MGQYYTPIIIREGTGTRAGMERFCSWHYDNNGMKLMEHSYVGNKFTETVVKQLVNCPGRLAWVGDYAEWEDAEEKNGEDAQNYIQKFLDAESEEYVYETEEEEMKAGYYSRPDEVSDMESSAIVTIINHTKKEYIDMWMYNKKNEDNIHPLPLLTSIGNGKGGGDYRGVNQHLVGSWCCDEIEVRGYFHEDGYKDVTNDIYFKE